MLDIASLKKRLTDYIDHEVARKSANLALYGDSPWWEGPNLWEPPVVLALKDLVKAGDVVFDVGGNMGGITSVLSRLAGPRGVVCTFEASPRIIGHLQQNVIKNGHRNVTVYHRAIYSKSNEILTIYDGDHLNDSIYIENSPSGAGTLVKSLALDDFCEASNLYPSLIKMDIEGAEYDALLGAQKLIAAHKPHFLLEQQASDLRCFDFLTKLSYTVIDLNNYRIIRSLADYPEGVSLRNSLFVHSSKMNDLPYSVPVESEEYSALSQIDFHPNHTKGFTTKEFELAPGRYLIDVNFTATGRDNTMFCGVRLGGRDLFRYHGYSSLIAGHYRDWVIDVPQIANAHLYFDFLNDTSDASLTIHGATIRKIKTVRRSLWSSLVCD